MFKKVLVIVLVLLLSGTTTVLANWNNNPFAGMFRIVPAGLQGTPAEEASDENAEVQTTESMGMNVQTTDADEDDGPPPWFDDMKAYQDWLDEGMEGPPPWAPVHARQNWVRSMSGERDNDEDDDEDGPPPWFKNQAETEDWIDGGQQGPPPWTPAHARNNSKKSQDED